MPASSMCSMTPRGKLGPVVERIDVDLDRVVEEPVDQHRVAGTRFGGPGDVGPQRASS